MSMTTALGQKKRGKDVLPPQEPEAAPYLFLPHLFKRQCRGQTSKAGSWWMQPKGGVGATACFG